MNLQELLEHAHLDALGQLDEGEQAAFEKAFAAAPPAVKAKVRLEQARMAPMEHLLPQVEPSPELRDRVLDAVAAAMVAREASDMDPRQGRRVSRAWRAAAIGMMSAVVVLSSAFVYVYNTNRANEKIAQDGLLADSTLSLLKGRMKESVLSPQTRRNFFLAQKGAEVEGRAALWSNPTWDNDRLFVDLPKSADGQNYRLVTLDTGGKIYKQLESFRSNGILTSLEVSKQASGTRLALVLAGTEMAADTGQILMVVTKA